MAWLVFIRDYLPDLKWGMNSFFTAMPAFVLICARWLLISRGFVLINAWAEV